MEKKGEAQCTVNTQWVLEYHTSALKRGVDPFCIRVGDSARLNIRSQIGAIAPRRGFRVPEDTSSPALSFALPAFLVLNRWSGIVMDSCQAGKGKEKDGEADLSPSSPISSKHIQLPTKSNLSNMGNARLLYGVGIQPVVN